MTGLQEHPGTGRTLAHEPTGRVIFEDLARTLGIPNVHVVDPVSDVAGFERLLKDCLASGALTVIVARRTCLLAAGKIRQYNRSAEEGRANSDGRQR